MRVAIYTRVSTKKRKTFRDETDQQEYQKMLQDTENQAMQLREHAKQQGWRIVKEYSDRASGSSSRKRTDFQQMFHDAEKGKFDLVLFWALDRFSREGTLACLIHLDRLAQCNVDFCAYREPYLSTMDPRLRPAIIGLISCFAKMEIDRMKERIHAGLDKSRKKAEAEGRTFRVGRKEVALDEARIAQLMAQGLGSQAIATALNAPEATIRRRMKKPSVILAAGSLSPWRRDSATPSAADPAATIPQQEDARAS